MSSIVKCSFEVKKEKELKTVLGNLDYDYTKDGNVYNVKLNDYRTVQFDLENGNAEYDSDTKRKVDEIMGEYNALVLQNKMKGQGIYSTITRNNNEITIKAQV